MKEQFVPYELAVKLKELGFDEPCLADYVSGTYGFEKVVNTLEIWNDEDVEILHSKIKAPLWQQSFDWFTRKGLHSYIEGAYPWFRYYINTDDDRYEGFKHLKIEEARQSCLEKLIEIVQNETI